MYAQSGKKLLFMGGEFGQRREWNHEESLEWHVLQYPLHAGLSRWVEELNRFYRDEKAMHEQDFDPAGFEWVDCQDADQSVVSLIRKGRTTDTIVLGVFNFTPVPRHNYRLGVPRGGFWREILNSDAKEYGGSGQGNIGGVEAAPISVHGRLHSVHAVVPPLGAVFFASEGPAR